jgi:hypothetical protein
MITHKHVEQKVITEYMPHQFCAEASTLSAIVEGFRAGWPEEIPTSIGNGMPLLRVAKKVVEGDIQYVRYMQANGCITLCVFND